MWQIKNGTFLEKSPIFGVWLPIHGGPGQWEELIFLYIVFRHAVINDYASSTKRHAKSPTERERDTCSSKA